MIVMTMIMKTCVCVFMVWNVVSWWDFFFTDFFFLSLWFLQHFCLPLSFLISGGHLCYFFSCFYLRHDARQKPIWFHAWRKTRSVEKRSGDLRRGRLNWLFSLFIYFVEWVVFLKGWYANDFTPWGREEKQLNIDDHLFVNVRVANDWTELIERYFAVLILVGEYDRLVNYLLKLGVFQIVANHHFQYLK